MGAGSSGVQGNGLPPGRLYVPQGAGTPLLCLDPVPAPGSAGSGSPWASWMNDVHEEAEGLLSGRGGACLLGPGCRQPRPWPGWLLQRTVPAS